MTLFYLNFIVGLQKATGAYESLSPSQTAMMVRTSASAPEEIKINQLSPSKPFLVIWIYHWLLII